jgi:hypothetical protein
LLILVFIIDNNRKEITLLTEFVMKKVLIAVALASVLSACASNPNEVLIDGQKYIKDKNGVLHITEEELKEIANANDVTFVEGEVPDLVISEEEMKVATTDEEAFFSLVGQANPDPEVSLFVKPGSLKANLERAVSENGWKALNFDGPDMFIAEPSILKAPNVPMATQSLIQDYDIYSCIDEENKVVTVIKDE